MVPVRGRTDFGKMFEIYCRRFLFSPPLPLPPPPTTFLAIVSTSPTQVHPLKWPWEPKNKANENISQLPVSQRIFGMLFTQRGFVFCVSCVVSWGRDMGVGLLNTPLVSRPSGRKLNISVLKFRASVQVLNLKITIGAAQEAWYICISIDQGVFPDLTWFMWLFIERTSEILLSLSNSGCFSLSSLPLYPHKVVKRAFSVVDSTKVYRKDGKPEVTCVILCFSDGNLRSFLLGKFEFTQK